MSNPIQSLNENFMYNSLLARALVPLMPSNMRYSLRMWLQKLHEVDGDIDVLKVRNEYMWFLLLSLQSRKITQPFSNDPPQGELQELKNIIVSKQSAIFDDKRAFWKQLPSDLYEDVLMSTDQNMSWVEKVASGKSGNNISATPVAPATPPSMFLQTQPKPKNGITCYMAAFSDHN